MNFELGFNLSELHNQASIQDRRLIADFSSISRPLLEVGVNSEGACNLVNKVSVKFWVFFFFFFLAIAENLHALKH